jgi:hypothetical protein
VRRALTLSRLRSPDTCRVESEERRGELPGLQRYACQQVSRTILALYCAGTQVLRQMMEREICRDVSRQILGKFLFIYLFVLSFFLLIDRQAFSCRVIFLNLSILHHFSFPVFQYHFSFTFTFHLLESKISTSFFFYFYFYFPCIALHRFHCSSGSCQIDASFTLILRHFNIVCDPRCRQLAIYHINTPCSILPLSPTN